MAFYIKHRLGSNVWGFTLVPASFPSSFPPSLLPLLPETQILSVAQAILELTS